MAELSPERRQELNIKIIDWLDCGMAIAAGMVLPADIPLLQRSMDDCLELIVPKLQSFVIGTYHEDGYLVPQGFYAQVENGLHNGFARGETVPLAFCLALEKMIDSRSGSSYLNARGVLPQGGMSDEEAMRRCRGE